MRSLEANFRSIAQRIHYQAFNGVWLTDNGRQACSETIYHYAPYVGVVKAIARFILYDGKGLETVNRLVETDLKSALVQGIDVRRR